MVSAAEKFLTFFFLPFLLFNADPASSRSLKVAEEKLAQQGQKKLMLLRPLLEMKKEEEEEKEINNFVESKKENEQVEEEEEDPDVRMVRTSLGLEEFLKFFFNIFRTQTEARKQLFHFPLSDTFSFRRLS